MVITKPLLLSFVLAIAAFFTEGWLGVRLAESEHPTVEEVLPDSPAAKAGLKHGDVFVSVNGKATRTVEALVEVLHATSPGETVTLVVRRGDKEIEVKAQLGTKPVEGRRPATVETGEAPRREGRQPPRPTGETTPAPGYLGVEPEQTDEGVQLVDVLSDSPAAKAGLRRGDRLRSIDGKQIFSLDDLDRVMRKVRARDALRIRVLRAGRHVDIAVTAGVRPASLDAPGGTATRERESTEREKSESSKKSKKSEKREKSEKTEKSEKGDQREPSKQGATGERGAQGAKGESPDPKVARARREPGRPASRGRPTAETMPTVRAGTRLAETLAKARRANRPVLVVFGASWCVNSQALKKSLADPSLKDVLSRYEQVWVDTDQESALADDFEVEAVPHVLVLAPSGETRRKVIGYQPAELLLPILRAGLAGERAEPKRQARRAPAQNPAPVARPDRVLERATGTGDARGLAELEAEIQRLRRQVEELRKEQHELRALLEHMREGAQKKK